MTKIDRNQPLQATAAALFHSTAVRDLMLRGFVVAQSTAAESACLGDSAELRKFNLLALGALLGLYSAGKIDKRVYGIGYALLPGFVLSKGSEVERL